KEQYGILRNNLENLMYSFVVQAERNIDVIMPGFTHMQHAQPVYLGHYLFAYYHKFKRDLIKLSLISEISNECPLGAGALAGTSHNIDRHYVSELLGFNKPTDNSIDTVSDRDFIIDYLYVCALIATHLSQISEELIIWSSQEFNYVAIDDSFTTGSSIMPNKKNPDVCELTRGKSGRIISNLNALFIMIKGLPLAYNRDLQDDKRILFETADSINLIIPVFTKMIESLKFNKNVMFKSLKKGFIEATDIADYLVNKNVPFREAHHISGNLVKYAVSNQKSLQDLSLDEFMSFSEKFSDDIFKTIDFKNIVESRKSYGSASLKNVKLQIKNAKKFLNL
ncbi:argininosuccinate lyase, partial [Candidatus Dependentiae bacterium]|nr:argininosuccinate lyase [Candidatus Dependentiae bacterium]